MKIEAKDQSLEIWVDDRLNRKQDAQVIQRFVVGQIEQRKNAGRQRTFVLNIDSDWGSGKSFFLTRFQQQLTADGYVAVYVNAWEDDHSNDPFLTVVSAISSELQRVFHEASEPTTKLLEKTRPVRAAAHKIIGGAMLSGGTHFAKRYLGSEAVEMMSDLWGNDDGDPTSLAEASEAIEKSTDQFLDGTGKALAGLFAHQKAARGEFRAELAALATSIFEATDNSPPVFILVDELDRCRPSYAVELLERIKHLFSIEDFVFVLGSDTEQLSHAIRALYGAGFDSERYLKRFVDRTYNFLPVKLDRFIEYAFENNGLKDELFTLPDSLTAVGFLQEMFKAEKIELRDIEQMMEMIATFVSVWPWQSLQIDLIYLLPLIHEKHLNKRSPEEPPLMSQKLRFRTYERLSKPTEKTLSKMVRQIKSAQTQRNYDNDQNSFDTWLTNKTVTERNHLAGKTDLLRTYRELIDVVERLSSD